MVEASLNLLQKAIDDDYDYFALISGGDYPVRPNTCLYQRLKEGGEYITIRKGCDEYNPLSRYKYYYFTDWYDRRDRASPKTKFFLWLQRSLRKLRIKKHVPFQLYTGTQWFILSRECVKYILHEVDSNKTYIKFFKTAFCSDECFFQTIIGNSNFLHQAKGNLTYTDWTARPGPAIITQKHLPALQNAKDKFFARKFTDDSAEVVEAIDKQLRTATISLTIRD
jgi:hypothetical protein